MSQVVHNKNIVRAFVEAINAQDWEALSGLVAPDFSRHSYAGGSPGITSRAALVDFLRSEFQTFPDARESIEDLVAEGNKIAARHHFTGTQRGAMGPYPPSGRVMSASYLAIYRLENGLIAEAWAEWDNLSGLVQLGHLAEGAQQRAPGKRP